ncbi:hypothetical protein F5I97DRAFT_1902619 [Phlebopus sp. FC_14]|nr:hypothetical protein F5I97DRAFT_1902619 [Phlebopus sp. FC_14]
MSLSLKAELETWAAALKAYDEQDFEKALDFFSRIADSSKILTNMGLIYATIGEHQTAVEQFTAATNLDPYLAIAYFQCGVSNFLLGHYDLAFTNFEEALLYLRGNQAINYEQIGLKFKLFSAEILFNKGLSQIYLGYPQEGMYDLEEARKEKVTDEHDVIDEAIRDSGDGYTVFSIPVGVLYRPSENKLKNSKSKDYLGKAKLVAASDANDAFTEFSGVARLKQKTDPDASPRLSRSATAPVPRTETVPKPGLERAQTTLNLAPDVRERINAVRTAAPVSRLATAGSQRSQSVSNAVSSGFSTRNNPSIRPGHARSSTAVSTLRPKTPQSNEGSRARPGDNATVRGLSVRRPQQLNLDDAGAGPAKSFVLPSAPSASHEPAPGLLSAIYEDYATSYSSRQPTAPFGVLAPQASSDHTAGWLHEESASGPTTSSALSNINGPNSMITRPPSRSSNAYAASATGAQGSLRKNTNRRLKAKRTATLAYEEDDGLVTGEYDDGASELSNIRVKLHYQGDVRGMTLSPQITFEQFVRKVTTKFGTAMDGLGLKFKDEDGVMITLRDESDYELAVETARDGAKGKPEGKLEVWCTDM